MSSEETARSIGGPFPLNATFRDVFEESRYSPLEMGQLHLAPSASAGTGDPNAKKCFTEAELAQKCPSLLYTPPPPPKIPTQCVPYTQVEFGDGYVKEFGDVDSGGFAPLIPASKIEKYTTVTCPLQGNLPLKDNDPTMIKAGGVEFSLLSRVAQAVYSIKYNGKEFLNVPNGTMFSTAAINVPKGTSDKLTRVGEASAAANVKTTSKVLKVAASVNTAYTQVQASYTSPPGTMVDGKKVEANSTLSSTTIEKRVAIADNRVVRYQTSIEARDPFVSGRFNVPTFALKPEFSKIFVYKKSTNSWTTPAEAKLSFDQDALAFIFTTTDHTNAMGVRVVDFPKPTSFGSKFNNTFHTYIVRSLASIAVASALTVGTRGGNADGIFAPAGKYCVTQDFVFGTLEYVQNLLNKVLGASSGSCPVVQCPTAPAGTQIVPGTIKSVGSADNFSVQYPGPTGEVIIRGITKPAHNFKVGENVDVMVELPSWQVKNVMKKGVNPAPVPTPAAGNAVVAGKIVAVPSNSVFLVSYFAGGVDQIKSVGKANHGFTMGQDVFVVTKPAPGHEFITALAAKPAAGAVPVQLPANDVKIGKVTAVVDGNKVTLSYIAGGRTRLQTVSKPNHGFAVGQAVYVVTKPAPDHSYLSVMAIPSSGTTPVPAGTPAGTLAGYDVKNGTITAVPSSSVFIVSYFAGGANQMKSVGKANHGFTQGQAVFVITKPAPDHSFVTAVATKPVAGFVPVQLPANDVKIGKVTAVTNANQVTITYTAAGKVQTKTVNKPNHGFAVGQSVYVTLSLPPTQAFLGVSAIPAGAPTPAPVPAGTPAGTLAGYDVKNGTITAVPSSSVFIVSYFAGGANQMKSVGKANHGFTQGQAVFVVTKPAPSHAFVTAVATKPAAGFVPVQLPANDVKMGKVTAVVNANQVTITYTAAGKVQTKTVNKPTHGFAVGQSVYVTVSLPPAHTFLGVSAIPAGASSPAPVPTVPAGTPAGTLVGYDVKNGTVTAVLNKDVYIVSYFAGGATQIKSVGKANHGFKRGQAVFVITKPAPDHSFVTAVATKPVAGFVPVQLPANDVKIGKVAAVINANQVTVTYMAAGKNQTKTVNKTRHGFKVGQSVYVTVTPPPTQAFLGVSAIPSAVPATATVVKSGKVVAVNGKDRVSITYMAGGKTLRKTVNKVNHGFKNGQTVYVVHKRAAPYAFVSVSATRPTTVPKPAPVPVPKPSTDLVKTGKVVAIGGKDRVSITYMAGGKTLRKTVNKVNHGFKNGQTVYVVHRRAAPYAFVSVSATKPGSPPAPTPTPAGTLAGYDVKNGKIAAVLTKDVYIVSYFAGGANQLKSVGKANHGFKKDQAVFVITKPAPSHAFVTAVATKPAAGSKPAQLPANDVKMGKVTKVVDANKVTITYTAAGKAQTKTVNKTKHGLKVGQSVYVTISPPPAQAFLAVNAA
ncbi:hypothetical protein ATCV1_Z649L [Acanthocystis turfacea chlorella virus 1]|uniref:Uncharacterized protein Z649L n=1 Tax=Chlorovirus heliozoae TaxID=322019 RepID=A7K9Q9_9PHYC|nr:hypothetical protein ATCV1_Z649L [Acanthocystis turfacea chlorella virus 1]ABT16783.1 hypothetical protein ATCV1_Z649L [Acanthocystis turfacea chlorella virus 1]